jgi:hypothetical protein
LITDIGSHYVVQAGLKLMLLWELSLLSSGVTELLCPASKKESWKQKERNDLSHPRDSLQGQQHSYHQKLGRLQRPLIVILKVNGSKPSEQAEVGRIDQTPRIQLYIKGDSLELKTQRGCKWKDGRAAPCRTQMRCLYSQTKQFTQRKVIRDEARRYILTKESAQQKI